MVQIAQCIQYVCAYRCHGAPRRIGQSRATTEGMIALSFVSPPSFYHMGQQTSNKLSKQKSRGLPALGGVVANDQASRHLTYPPLVMVAAFPRSVNPFVRILLPASPVGPQQEDYTYSPVRNNKYIETRIVSSENSSAWRLVVLLLEYGLWQMNRNLSYFTLQEPIFRGGGRAVDARARHGNSRRGGVFECGFGHSCLDHTQPAAMTGHELDPVPAEWGDPSD